MSEANEIFRNLQSKFLISAHIRSQNTRNIRERSERIYEELPKAIPKYCRRRFRSIMAERLLVKGIVVAGAGEGSYYMAQKHYRNEFKKKLGFEPYLGTLNLELRGSELEKLNILRSAKGVTVEKFENERGMSFGAVKCFPAEIEKIYSATENVSAEIPRRNLMLQSIKCALLLPEKSKYRNVVEIICKEHLRKKLELKNGSLVEITVFIRERCERIISEFTK